MSKLTKSILGIQVSKDTLKVVLIHNKQIFIRHFSNSANGFRLIQSMLEFLEIEKVHTCLEANDFYSVKIANFLYEQGHTVSIVSLKQLKKYIQSQTQSTKTKDHQSAEQPEKENPLEWFPKLTDAETSPVKNWALV